MPRLISRHTSTSLRIVSRRMGRFGLGPPAEPVSPCRRSSYSHQAWTSRPPRHSSARQRAHTSEHLDRDCWDLKHRCASFNRPRSASTSRRQGIGRFPEVPHRRGRRFASLSGFHGPEGGDRRRGRRTRSCSCGDGGGICHSRRRTSRWWRVDGDRLEDEAAIRLFAVSTSRGI